MPALVVVTGAPGSGKSTTARALAERLGFPLAAKDDVKELLWDEVGPGDRDRFLLYGRASYPILLWFARANLLAGTSVLLEANFTPDVAGRELHALHSLVPFTLVQVLCRADPETCLARFRARHASGHRHDVHAVGVSETEASLAQRLAQGVWDEPIPFGDHLLVVVDTTQPVDADELAAHVGSLIRLR